MDITRQYQEQQEAKQLQSRIWLEYLIQPKFQQVNEGFRSKGPSGVSGLADCAIGFFIFKGHKFPIRVLLLWCKPRICR
jgi:hypothetical protein